MSQGMTFQFDSADVDRLNNRMLAVQGLGNLEPGKVVRRTGKSLAWNLYRATMISKKAEPPHLVEGKFVWAYIHPKRQKGVMAPRQWLPVTIEQANRHGVLLAKRGSQNVGKTRRPHFLLDGRSVIQGRGYARAAWLAIIARMGWGKGTKQSAAARRYSDDRITELAGGALAAIEMANQIPYIMAMDQGTNGNPPGNILSKAIQATIGDLERDMQNLARKLEKTFA